jgi:hypothetical protein
MLQKELKGSLSSISKKFQPKPNQTKVSMDISFSHGTAKLNEEQAVVVTADLYEHQRILASAGSGKTTTITARISYLIEHYGVDPSQILLVTFSRNASREMIHRIRNLCGPVNIWAGTFHALAKKILTLYDYNSVKELFFIDELPVRLTQWARTEKGRKWVGTLRYVIVDEFQDINAIQWRLLETLRHPGVRFIIVGDDAQNIYTWRGSSARYLLDYHTVVRSVRDYQLRMNYRSSEAIVAVANRVMNKIPTLDWKQTMLAVQKGGLKPEVLFFWRLSDESLWVAKTIIELFKQNSGQKIAVLARNNIDLYRVEEVLLQNNIPCRFLSSEDVNTNSDAVVAPITKNYVDLSTFHGSKGLEWDVTFCICLSDDRLPGRKTKESIVHERRLFYVAITRARRRMFLTYHGNERHLSRFVREIGYKFLQYHGLAKYALSDVELGEQQPSLKSLLEVLDGDDWQMIRDRGELPFTDSVPCKEFCYMSWEDTWKPPTWCDPKLFNGFLHLFMKRRILQHYGWLRDYADPFLERLLFRIRIFAEDAEFWKMWQTEITEMVHTFFADSAKMPPAGYTDVATWVEAHGHVWSQEDCIKATSILAKIRGQLRPLRFDAYSLDEFTICPTRVVVPTEYRADVLRSWRKFVNPEVSWKDCLIDIWRLSSLYQVAEGRNAGLYRINDMHQEIQNCLGCIESVERFLGFWLGGKQGLILNPECVYDELNAIGCDCILENSVVVFTGEGKPDLELWIESLLKAYCFMKSGTIVESIQLVNPFRGLVWHVEPLPIKEIDVLYKRLLSMWRVKQGV